MPFLTVNGFTVPVVDHNWEEIEFGSREDAFSGRSILNRRSTKRQINCKTAMLSATELEAVRGIIRGDGQVWSYDQENYYAPSGMAPSLVYGTPYRLDPNLRYDDAVGDGGELLPRVIDRMQGAVPTTTFVQESTTKFPVGYNGADGGAFWFDPPTTNLMPVGNFAAVAAPANAPTDTGSGDIYDFSRTAAAGNALWRNSTFLDCTPTAVGQPVSLSFEGRASSPSGAANMTFAIEFYNAANALQSTQSYSITIAGTSWRRFMLGAVRSNVLWTKCKILLTDATVSVHSTYYRLWQFENNIRPTMYTPNGAARTLATGFRYNLARYAVNFAQTGFAVLMWTPMPNAFYSTNTTMGIFTLGDTGIDGGATGEHRIGLEANLLSNTRFLARGADLTYGNSIRQGATGAWRLQGLIYRPSAPSAPWGLVENGVASFQTPAAVNNIDPSQLINLYVGGTGDSGGAMQNPAWCPIDEVMFFPFEITDAQLANIAARTTGFGNVFPRIEVSGDIVNGRKMICHGMVKGGGYTPQMRNGVWQKNVGQLEFSLREV